MSFTQEVKKEILSRTYAHEQAYEFISGLITSSGQKDGSKWIVKFNRSDIAFVVRDMIDQMDIKHSYTRQNRNWIIFEDFEPKTQIKMPGDYFAGVFLGGGSVSNPDTTSYHLEIAFHSHANAVRVKNFLNKYDFEFTLIQRRTQHILYLKKAEQISDFLKAVQAFNSMLYFEDARINRDMKNLLNRYSNLDVHNQKRLALANKEFSKKYNFLKEKSLLNNFRKPELDFYELKLKNPYSSLSELVEMFEEKTNISKTRAGLNHYLIKLRKIYDENK